MKRWLKWTLGVVGIIIAIFVVLVVWNWEMISILTGTEGLSGDENSIPAVSEQELNILNTGEADWGSWYGPDGQRRSFVKGIKTDWSAGLRKLWEVNYLCQGDQSATWSAPVIQGNRLIICGRDSDRDLVFCLDPVTGKLLWQGSYPAKASPNHGTGLRATPFIDKNRVYTFGRSGDLICWRLMDGKAIWHKNVTDEGGQEPTWGHSSSPLVIDDLVLVQGGGSCRTIAYEKHTGNVAWKSGTGLAGYAALATMTIDNIKTLLVFHGMGLAALILEDGNELWNVKWKTPNDINATTPVVIEDRVFITSGNSTGSMLLKANRTRADSIWRIESFASLHSDPYVIDDYLYGYSGDSYQNKGAFKCINLSNGEEKWTTNEMGWGTCVFVDGYLLCCDIKGNIFLMKPNPNTFVKVTELPSALGDIRGPVWTTPVISNNRLYLRFKQKLICYDIIG
jgi:outer membrane protein assembly factor BamB